MTFYQQTLQANLEEASKESAFILGQIFAVTIRKEKDDADSAKE